MSAGDGQPVVVKIRTSPDGTRRLTLGHWLVVIAPSLGPESEPIERRERGFAIAASNCYSDSLLFEDWQPDWPSAREVVLRWIAERIGARNYGARGAEGAA